MFYYSISHYYDIEGIRSKNKYRNIKNHFQCFLNLEIKDKTFIIVSAVNTHDINYHKTVREDLLSFCSDINSKYPIEIIVIYNWGGTIAGLWEVYNSKIGKSGYICHFEEDFGPKNNDFVTEAKLKLKNHVYVGETTTGFIKSGNDDGRDRGKHIGQPRLGNPEVWTDGGFYFSTIDKLSEVSKKIGIFHKGNPKTRYTNIHDGISLGEVGFPTILYHNGFTFDTLPRNAYFINEWND